MGKNIFLIKNAIVLTNIEKAEITRDCSILIEDNIISKVGKNIEVPLNISVIDAKNCIAIPGLINTHHHLYQSFTRCLKPVQNVKLFSWLTHLYEVWKEIDYNLLYLSSLISLSELLLSGCTTCSDLFYIFPKQSDIKLEAVIDAAKYLGVRIHAGRGSMSLGKSKGGLPPDDLTQTEDEIIDDCVRLIENFHDPKPFSMVRIDLAPCSPFSITSDLMKQTIELGKSYNVLCHTHLAETLDEENFCLEKFCYRPLAYMENLGWLGNNVYFAHCVHLNKDEIKLLSDTSTGVAHCPSSNMRLGSGIAPIVEMLEHGVKVGLAVDGSSSNDTGNLLGEARQAMLLQRVKNGADSLKTEQSIQMATIGGARVLNREELGKIEVGKAADISIYNLNKIEYAGACERDPLGSLVLCQPTQAEYVICNGKIIVDKGIITTIDLPQVIEDFNDLLKGKFGII